MNPEDFLKKSREKVKDTIQEMINSKVETLGEGIRYAVSDPYKVRSCYMLAIADSYGKEDKVLPFAASAELIQDASLIYDDIIDYGKERWGKKSAWMKYGLPFSILIGLGSLNTGFRPSNYSNPELSLKLQKILVNSFYRSVEGEALEMEFQGNEEISFEEYKRMVEMKNGAFFGSCLKGTGIIIGLGSEEPEGLDKFGRNLAIALQVNKDLWELEERSGREIKQGKRSTLTTHSINNASEEKKKRLIEILNKPWEENTEKEIKEATEIMRSAGSFEFAKEFRDKVSSKALKGVERLENEELKSKLEEISEYILGNPQAY